MSLKKAAGIGLVVLGAALIAGGIYVGSRDNAGIEAVRVFAMYLGGVLMIGGLVLILGRDIVLIPWGAWGPRYVAKRCYVMGVGTILMSFFPLSLAIRDPYYRVISLATFVGAVLVGVVFLVAGRKLGRNSGGDSAVH